MGAAAFILNLVLLKFYRNLIGTKYVIISKVTVSTKIHM